MNKFKSFLFRFLAMFTLCDVVPAVLDYLQEQASKTESEVDDNVITALRFSFMSLFPQCFDE